jgi:hypothetical protein
METDTDKLLKSVIETLIKKEAPKFKSLIQKELASRIYDKIEELKKALSGQIVTGVQDKKEEETPVALPENLPGAPSAPPVTSPTKAGDLRIVPTTAGAAKDDISLDPNFEKEFYHSSEKYKNQEVIIKQLGTGFGKPVRVYINGRRWEFFAGPKVAMKATKEYIDSMVKDVKKDPQLAANMTAQIKKDKAAGVAQVAAPVDAGKPNEVADADLKRKELETGKPIEKKPQAKKPPAK